MRRILYSAIVGLAAVFAGAVLYQVPASAVTANDMFSEACKTAPNSAVCRGKSENVGSFVKKVSDYLLWIVGVLGVLMLIWGGIRYMTSGGDSQKLTTAKNTILYTSIGLVIAVFSYAIVMWLDSNVKLWK